MKNVLVNGLLVLIALIGWGGHKVVAQNRIDLTLKYNTTTSLYEVYGRPNFTDPAFGVGAGTQITVVLPASVADNALTVTSVNGGAWSDASKVYAPTADPSNDFHGIATAGNYTALVSGQETLFFTFGVTGTCLPGIRLFDNTTDPSSSAAGFSGGDYKNYIGDALNAGEDVYRINYTTPGGLCGIAPTIGFVSPASGTQTNANPPISGTATPGASVTVGEGNTTICTTIASSAGTWSCSNPTPFSAGPHTLTAVASNLTGSSPVATTSFTVVGPATIAILGPVNGTTTTTTPTISGTATPNSSVTVGENGTTLCTTTATASGAWSCPGITLTTGPHTITAVASNLGGPSPAATTSFTVVPNSSTLTAGPGTVFNDLNGNCTADAGESLSGLPTPLYVKLISTATPAVAQQVVAIASNGSFTFTGITDGTYTVIVDDNATLSDVTPVAGYLNASRGSFVATNGTVQQPSPAQFCLQSTCPPFTLPTLSK
ncbi:Ig-like domain-containing protein [Spirosoma lituiforme]